MKYIHLCLIMLLSSLSGCGSNELVADIDPSISITPETLNFSSSTGMKTVMINANAGWTISSNQSWCTAKGNGSAGNSILEIEAATNRTTSQRTAVLTFLSGTYKKQYSVTQDAGEAVVTVPAGYELVWQDEFNTLTASLPGSEWRFETGNNDGWGNHEAQNYVNRVLGKDTVAKIQNGVLTITAFKLSTPYQGADIISARMNTDKSWTYGYFEMSAKLPGGRGAWPAFWMMPKYGNLWPLDGEIDIMEYVGYDPTIVHSTIHTQAYHHSIGTQKAGTIKIETAETDFHVYGLEWTADEITGYCDGKAYFNFKNDKTGNKDTWPFDQAFYLKLNLAIGGDWGGAQGIDAAIFPARYEIDYVRVYQKK